MNNEKFSFWQHTGMKIAAIAEKNSPCLFGLFVFFCCCFFFVFCFLFFVFFLFFLMFLFSSYFCICMFSIKFEIIRHQKKVFIVKYDVGTFCTIDSFVARLTSIQAASVYVMALFIIQTFPTCLVTVIAKHSSITPCSYDIKVLIILTYNKKHVILRCCSILNAQFYILPLSH